MRSIQWAQNGARERVKPPGASPEPLPRYTQLSQPLELKQEAAPRTRPGPSDVRTSLSAVPLFGLLLGVLLSCQPASQRFHDS